MGRDGWTTPDERHKARDERIIAAIQQWEKIAAQPLANADEVRAAEKVVLDEMFALWPKRVFHFNGKRYRKISNRNERRIEVT